MRSLILPPTIQSISDPQALVCPTVAEAVVEEGTLVGISAPVVHGEILTQLWMSLAALINLARKAITCVDSVQLPTFPSKLAMAVLIVLAHDGHFDFLLCLSV